MADIDKIQVPINGSDITYNLKDSTARQSISNLAPVAMSGDYDDLLDKPTIPEAADSWATKNTTVITATSENPVDLDDFKTPGNYSSADSSVSQYILNAPTTSAGFNLIVMRLANFNSRIRQIAIINGATAIYTRYCGSSGWGSWVNIAKDTTYSVITQSQISTGTDTTLRTVRADYLKAGIQDIINQDAWSTHNATTITATSGSPVDLNDYTIPGNYMCTSNATSEFVNNKPTGSTKSGFRLIVIRVYNTTTYVRQFAIVHGSNSFYSRYLNTSGEWSDWISYSTSNTIPSAYSTTAASTATKAASCSGYALKSNGQYIHLILKNANSVQDAITLNINSTGAKPIYINGTASGATNYTLPAGSYIAFYDGTNYYINTDDKLPANISGSADSLKCVNTSSVSSITNAPGDYKANIENKILSSATGLFPAKDDSNAILQINRMNGNYDSQLGFSSNGELYYRSFDNEALNATKYWGRLIKEYTFTKTYDNYAYFYFSLSSSGSVILEIESEYGRLKNYSYICMDTQGTTAWAPTAVPHIYSQGQGSATYAHVGKTNNILWIATDTKGYNLRVRVLSANASIIDFQHNNTNPVSLSDEYNGAHLVLDSTRMYSNDPKIVKNRGIDESDYLYNYNVKRVFIEVPYSGAWTDGDILTISDTWNNKIGNVNIRILSYSISVYQVSGSYGNNVCGGLKLMDTRSQDRVGIINDTGIDLTGDTGSKITLMLEYIEM